MAEHADTSQEELSETARAARTPATAVRDDEGSSDMPGQASSNETSAEAAPPSVEAEEDLADEADDDAAVDDGVAATPEDAAPEKERVSPLRLAAVWGWSPLLLWRVWPVGSGFGCTSPTRPKNNVRYWFRSQDKGR